MFFVLLFHIRWNWSHNLPMCHGCNLRWWSWNEKKKKKQTIHTRMQNTNTSKRRTEKWHKNKMNVDKQMKLITTNGNCARIEFEIGSNKKRAFVLNCNFISFRFPRSPSIGDYQCAYDFNSFYVIEKRVVNTTLLVWMKSIKIDIFHIRERFPFHFFVSYPSFFRIQFTIEMSMVRKHFY